MNYVMDKAGKRLIETGVLPPSTVSFQIVSQVNRPVRLITERFLTDEEYKHVLEIMQANWEPSKVDPFGRPGLSA